MGEGAHRARLASRAEHAAAAEHARVSLATTSSYEPAYLPVSKSGRVLCEKGRVQENGNRTPRRCRGREPTQLQAPRGR